MDKILQQLSSMKLAVALFIIIAVVSFAGTLMPQEKANQFIYGSFWFMSLLGILIINTLACLIKKTLTMQTAGSYLMHAGVPFIMAGALIGLIWGQSGMMIIEQGRTMSTLLSATGNIIRLPFELKLNKFTLEKYPLKTSHQLYVTDEAGRVERLVFNNENDILKSTAGGYEIKIGRIVPDFVMGEDKKPSSRSDDWNNPAVLISSKGQNDWLFAFYPDFHGETVWPGNTRIKYVFSGEGGGVKSYISDVDVSAGEKHITGERIEVNKPLKFNGWCVYQNSYDDKGLKWSGLFVKKDPGVPVVYFGFILLCAGMFAQAFKKINSSEGVQK